MKKAVLVGKQNTK